MAGSPGWRKDKGVDFINTTSPIQINLIIADQRLAANKELSIPYRRMDKRYRRQNEELRIK